MFFIEINKVINLITLNMCPCKQVSQVSNQRFSVQTEKIICIHQKTNFFEGPPIIDCFGKTDWKCVRIVSRNKPITDLTN